MSPEFARHFEANMKGQAYPAVRSDDVSHYRLALPRLPEQRAIAAVLDSIDEAIERAREEGDMLQLLKISTAGRSADGAGEGKKENRMSDRDISTGSDLPITLYLNQRLTFDILATLENGFSHFATVNMNSTDTSSTEISTEAQVGFSNVFAFLGVTFGGSGSRQREGEQNESATKEIVHTPASLFPRLRKDLCGRCLVRDISEISDLAAVHPGDFVEFEATLRRNPFVELLSAFAELLPLVELFNEQTAT